MAINGIFHFNLNCRDLAKSQAFFETVGFKLHRVVGGETRPESEKVNIRRALQGVPYSYDGALMLAGALRLDLLCYSEPTPADLPPRTSLDYGVARVCFESSDVDADYERLKGEGVEFISEPINIGWEGQEVRWCSFYDPDRNIFQLAQIVPLTDAGAH